MPNLDELLSIMARLRHPEGGCPWDLAQDFASISPHTIEEAYEVDEAIASGDLEALRDELGDLLFQVVFQARIAEEQGAFDFAGVVDAIVDKLVRRHPHIFADAATPSTVEGQRLHWEEIKAAERAAAGEKQEGGVDPFAGIPRSLPALARSAKVAGRLERLADPDDRADPASHERTRARVDARLESVAEHGRQVAAKVAASREEVASSREARAVPQEVERGIGAGLRAWALLARELGIDPEQALREEDDRLIEGARRR